MGTFDPELHLLLLDSGRDWRVTRAFAYTTWVKDERGARAVTITVPAGAETDFASVPRFFWRLFPPTGRYGKAAVVHDYIYRTPDVKLTREQADQVFLDGMEDLGVGWWTRHTMYRAVRLFGGGAFKARA